MRPDRLLPFLFLFASSCSASFVHGSIYGQDFQKLNNTMITIQGAYSYQLVTEKGNYSLFLPPGHYAISASSASDGGTEVFTQEAIDVGADDQQLDLVLKPKEDLMPYALAILSLVFILAIGLLFLTKKPKPAQSPIAPEPKKSNKLTPDEAKSELDSDAKSVLAALDSMEGRATQKELRESLGFSDSKLSLILSELESLGKIRKFKRGRGNIIRKTA